MLLKVYFLPHSSYLPIHLMLFFVFFDNLYSNPTNFKIIFASTTSKKFFFPKKKPKKQIKDTGITPLISKLKKSYKSDSSELRRNRRNHRFSKHRNKQYKTITWIYNLK